MVNTIVPMNLLFEKILGSQEEKANILYRPLKFLLHKSVNDGFLIYNLLTKQIILINEEEYQYIIKRQTEYSSVISDLVKAWYFVPIDFDETKCFYDMKKFYKLIDKEEYINSFTILTTTNCNARCFYCFEQGQKHVDMSEKVAMDTAKYIVNVSNGKKVLIKWFGGEPLLNIKSISIISKYLRENNIDFSSNIVTNAYLFDQNNICLAKNLWNVKNVQVTLDGTEEVYNRTKAFIYKGDKNPFARVINNIANLSENGINTIIRLNLDTFNKDNLYQLVDYLKTKFDGKKNISIYSKLLFDMTGPLQKNRNNDERNQLFDEYKKFEKYIIKNGLYHYQKFSNKIKYEHCISESDHGVVILPTGDLGMCECRTDSDICGNIYDGIMNFSLVEAYKKHQSPIDACDRCQIRPMCDRLKCCPYYIRQCEDYERNLYIERYTLYMEYTYELYKSGV